MVGNKPALGLGSFICLAHNHYIDVFTILPLLHENDKKPETPKIRERLGYLRDTPKDTKISAEERVE